MQHFFRMLLFAYLMADVDDDGDRQNGGVAFFSVLLPGVLPPPPLRLGVDLWPLRLFVVPATAAVAVSICGLKAEARLVLPPLM